MTADPSAEGQRLVSLGATLVVDLRNGLELADPDGNEFGVRAGRTRGLSRAQVR